MIDLEVVAEAADASLAADNTVATPTLQYPLEFGGDVDVHSLTKYLGGHTDVVGGASVTDDLELDERLGFHQNSAGATPDPVACFLVRRGTKSPPVRMERHSENARRLAGYLEDHPAIDAAVDR